MSTLAEIKDAAARLPAEQRTELITWLGQAEDVSRIRREQLRQEIQIGLDEIERGEVAPRHSCARRRLNFAKATADGSAFFMPAETDLSGVPGQLLLAGRGRRAQSPHRPAEIAFP
jgi:hypothetical protein